MSATSRDQLAGLVLPFGILALCASDAGKRCKEFIPPNFGKSFFAKDPLTFTDRYKACDQLLGVHPPNWTNSERLAALAAFGAL